MLSVDFTPGSTAAGSSGGGSDGGDKRRPPSRDPRGGRGRYFKLAAKDPKNGLIQLLRFCICAFLSRYVL